MSGQQQQLNKRLSSIYSALDMHQFSKVVNKLTSIDDEHVLLLYALRAHALEKSGKTHLAVDCILRILCQLFPNHEWLEWIEQQWYSQLLSSPEEEGDKTKDFKDVSLFLLPSPERQQHLWKNYKEMQQQLLLQRSSTSSKSNKSKKKKEKEVTIPAIQQLDEVRTLLIL